MAYTQTDSAKTGSGRLLLLAVLFTVFQITGMVLSTMVGGLDLPWILISLLMAIVCFAMYFAYRSHSKNLMKPMLGAALMLQLVIELDWGGYYLQYIGEVTELYKSESAFAIYAMVQILILFVIAGINVMHYVINASHHSNPKKVKFNQALWAAYIVLVAIQCVCFILLDSTAMFAVGDCLTSVSDVFAMGIVICIESSMDEFRLAREAKANEENEEN